MKSVLKKLKKTITKIHTYDVDDRLNWKLGVYFEWQSEILYVKTQIAQKINEKIF